MLAAFSMVAIIMQAWATKKHNRFLLLMAFVLDTVCLGNDNSIIIIIISNFYY